LIWDGSRLGDFFFGFVWKGYIGFGRGALMFGCVKADVIRISFDTCYDSFDVVACIRTVNVSSQTLNAQKRASITDHCSINLSLA
jgi:hypothetical protein